MSEVDLTRAEKQLGEFHDAVQSLCQQIHSRKSEEEKKTERLLQNARCLLTLVELRSKAHGRPLSSRKDFRLEKVRLDRYLDKVSSLRRKERQQEGQGPSEGTCATGRIIAHSLWSDLNPEQKQQFKVLRKSNNEQDEKNSVTQQNNEMT